MVAAFGVAESPEGDSLYAYPARESLWSPNGVAKIMQGAKPVRLAAEAFLLCVRVVAGFAPCRVAIRQPSNAPPLLLSPAGLASRRGPHTKTRLGLCPKPP